MTCESRTNVLHMLLHLQPRDTHYRICTILTSTKVRSIVRILRFFLSIFSQLTYEPTTFLQLPTFSFDLRFSASILLLQLQEITTFTTHLLNDAESS